MWVQSRLWKNKFPGILRLEPLSNPPKSNFRSLVNCKKKKKKTTDYFCSYFVPLFLRNVTSQPILSRGGLYPSTLWICPHSLLWPTENSRSEFISSSLELKRPCFHSRFWKPAMTPEPAWAVLPDDKGPFGRQPIFPHLQVAWSQTQTPKDSRPEMSQVHYMAADHQRNPDQTADPKIVKA